MPRQKDWGWMWRSSAPLPAKKNSFNSLLLFSLILTHFHHFSLWDQGWAKAAGNWEMLHWQCPHLWWNSRFLQLETTTHLEARCFRLRCYLPLGLPAILMWRTDQICPSLISIQANKALHSWFDALFHSDVRFFAILGHCDIIRVIFGFHSDQIQLSYQKTRQHHIASLTKSMLVWGFIVCCREQEQVLSAFLHPHGPVTFFFQIVSEFTMNLYIIQYTYITYIYIYTNIHPAGLIITLVFTVVKWWFLIRLHKMGGLDWWFRVGGKALF